MTKLTYKKLCLIFLQKDKMQNMVDIYDIKYKIFELFFPITYTIFIFLIVFILFYFFVLKIFFKEEKNTKKEEVIIKIDKIKEKLKYLEDNIESLNRSIFYKEVDRLIRNIIFRDTKNTNIFFATLSEIRNIFWDEDFYLIFKKNYFLIFDDKENDNLEVRKEILQNIKNQIF